LFNLLCVANQYYRSDELFIKMLIVSEFLHLRDEIHSVMMVFIFGHRMRIILTFLGFDAMSIMVGELPFSSAFVLFAGQGG